eukprot:9489031-Pyramimonas_sp.AAC.1
MAGPWYLPRWRGASSHFNPSPASPWAVKNECLCNLLFLYGGGGRRKGGGSAQIEEVRADPQKW